MAVLQHGEQHLDRDMLLMLLPSFAGDASKLRSDFSCPGSWTFSCLFRLWHIQDPRGLAEGPGNSHGGKAARQPSIGEASHLNTSRQVRGTLLPWALAWQQTTQMGGLSLTSGATLIAPGTKLCACLLWLLEKCPETPQAR